MGFLDRFMNKAESSQPLKDLKAPVSGKAISLEEVDDGVFSTGMLGNGIGIIPESETIVAPCAGEIMTTMPETMHAVGMKLNNGMEILIHIGIDTVEMKGKGFKSYIEKGDKVKAGQKLISFTKADIAAAGYRDVTIFVLTNSDDYPDVKFHSGMDVVAGETVVADL